MGRTKRKKKDRGEMVVLEGRQGFLEAAEPEFTVRRRGEESLFLKGKSLVSPMLRFTDYAWQRLKHFCYSTPTEVSGFGISSNEDPLLVEDFIILRQEASAGHTDLNGEAIGELVYDMSEQGKEPYQCSRIWIHTHPEMGADPSGIDEATFQRVFANYDWAVMCIISMLGDVSARLRVKTSSLSFSIELPVVVVDLGTCEDLEKLKASWDAEYAELVTPFSLFVKSRGKTRADTRAVSEMVSDMEDLNGPVGGISQEELETFDLLYDLNLDGGWVE